MKFWCQNVWFWRCRNLKIKPWLQPQRDFTFFDIFEKYWKYHENGHQKVIKIHEKSTLGRSGVDFLSSEVDFGRASKKHEFSMPLKWLKKLTKSVRRSSRRRRVTNATSPMILLLAPWVPGAASRATRYKILEARNKVQRHMKHESWNI